VTVLRCSFPCLRLLGSSEGSQAIPRADMSRKVLPHLGPWWGVPSVLAQQGCQQRSGPSV